MRKRELKEKEIENIKKTSIIAFIIILIIFILLTVGAILWVRGIVDIFQILV